ncbi:hypothetical protein MBLNU459_g5351t1 [Dothideomycetes sp. NU459]
MVLNVEKPTDPKGLTLEAWAQGFMVGALLMMAAITVANMRKKVLLHKLILVELIFGMFQGTFIFPDPPYYAPYLSVGAIFLNASWSLHNVIAWLKNKPFLSRKVSMIYIGTVILVQPYWVIEIVANWLYFSNKNDLFQYTRPYEALFRDPWWIFTSCSLFWNIKRRYEFSILELCRVSPRFAILLLAMCLSVCFIIVDILSVTHVINGSGTPDGINPWWKLAFVFKCLTDTVILDDFKTALDRLKRYRLKRLGSFDVDALSATNNDHGEMAYAYPQGRRSSEFPLAASQFNSPQWMARRESSSPSQTHSPSPPARQTRQGSAVKARDWADMQIEYVDLEMQPPERARTKSQSS